MKIIDEKGKLFGKINVIDLLVVIAIFALCLGTFVKFRTSDTYLKKDTVLEYTVLVENVRTPTVEAVNQKKTGILDYETKKEIGDITDLDTMTAKELEFLNDGTYKEIEFSDKHDILLTLKVTGTETTDNFYTTSGKKLIVGDTLVIYNGYMSTSGTIKSVKVLE